MFFNEQQARWQYRLLGHDGFYSRVRCQNMQEGKGYEEILKGEEEFIKWARPLNGKGNLFIGRNPRDKEGEVVRATCVTLDIDPVRPKAEASSEDQHRNALRIGQAIVTKYGGGNICSSGNGALLIFPLEQPVYVDLPDFEKRCKLFEQIIREEFETPELRIDSTYDLARLVKTMGSTSAKGNRLSWRQARFLHSPVFRAKQPGLSRLFESFNLKEQSGAGLVLPEGAGGTPLCGLRDYGAGERVGEHQSRSEADVALAHRLKLEGLGPADCLRELGRLSFRPERSDDHRRIVEKLYAEGTGLVQGGTNGPVVGGTGDDIPKLWTPTDGFTSEVLGVGGLSAGEAISTGFKGLDAKLGGGFRAGAVFCVQAVTNAGKSTFAIQSALNVCRSGKRVLYVTTEANLEEFCQRYRAIGSGLSWAKVSASDVTASDREALARFDEEFKKHQIGVYYSVSPRKEIVEKFIQDVKPDVVLWDYFQHMDTGVEHRTTVLADMARWYQGIALKYNIAIVVAAQLHSVLGDYKKGERRAASMHDVKDSKVINDTSKTVLVMDWMKGQDQEGDSPVMVQWDVAKNKGPMGRVQMVLDRTIPRFIEP